MIEYKYYVHDDEGKIKDAEFDNFEDAFDYAQDGLITFIAEEKFEDGNFNEEDSEIVWTWDDIWDKDGAVAMIQARHSDKAPEIDEDVEIDVKLDDETVAKYGKELVRAMFGDDVDFFDSEFDGPVDEEQVKELEVPKDGICYDDCENNCCADDAFVGIFESKDEDLVDIGVKNEQELEYAEDGVNVNKEDKVITYDADQKKDLKENAISDLDEYEASLEEDAHPHSAQDEIDHKLAYNTALKIAKENNCPVIYGYFGSDKHGGRRYFEIDPVICGDKIDDCVKEVINKYHPAGSVLTAYPDKSFVKEEFEDEMSDEEFAEALRKGLEEKHNKENLCENLADLVDKYYAKIPGEIEYDDLDAEVYDRSEGIFGNLYKYTFEIDNDEHIEKLLTAFFNKKADEITEEDLKNIDENKIIEFAKDLFREEAQEEAVDKYDHNKLGWEKERDSIIWYDDDESDADHLRDVERDMLDEGIFDNVFKNKVEKVFNKFIVVPFKKDSREEEKEKAQRKTFNKLKDAEAYAKSYSANSQNGKARIYGVDVVQEYKNHFTEPLNLVYVYNGGKLERDEFSNIVKQKKIAVKDNKIDAKMNKAAAKSNENKAEAEANNAVEVEDEKDLANKIEVNKVEDNKAEQPKVNQNKQKQIEAKNRNDKILNALKDAGADQAFLDKLSAKNNNQRVELSKLRKAIFGESLEDSEEILDEDAFADQVKAMAKQDVASVNAVDSLNNLKDYTKAFAKELRK